MPVFSQENDWVRVSLFMLLLSFSLLGFNNNFLYISKHF